MIAEKNIKRTENSSVELSITLTAESVEKAYQEKLVKYAKDLTIKGFRKGKTPTSVVEKKYGESIRNESTYDQIDAGLKEALDELEADQKPLPFSQPVLLDEENLTPFKPNTDVTFAVKYDVTPEVEVKGYTDGTFEIDAAEPTEDDINAKIEDYRQKDAMVLSRSNGDAAAQDDIATIDYFEVGADEAMIEGTKREDFTFTIGTGTAPYDLTEDVAGMKMGETKVVNKTYAEDFSDKDLAGTTKTVSVTLKELKYNDIPEVDDEFAQDIKEEYKTVADLKKGIKGELEVEIADIIKNNKIATVIDKMIEDNEITLPESMVEAQTQQTLKNYFQNMGISIQQLSQMISPEQMSKFAEDIKPQAIKDLKSSLILENIAKAEKIEASEDEIKKMLADENIDTSKYTKEQLDYINEQIKFQIQSEKAADFIVEHNTFNLSQNKKSYAELTYPTPAAAEAEEAAEEAEEAE